MNIFVKDISMFLWLSLHFNAVLSSQLLLSSLEKMAACFSPPLWHKVPFNSNKPLLRAEQEKRCLNIVNCLDGLMVFF